MVRSPHAKARIRRINAAAALAAPGVLAVYTGADIEDEGYGALPCLITRQRADGQDMYLPPNFPLRKGVVQYVGDYVAFVVAETQAEARDAAELVDVDYDGQSPTANKILKYSTTVNSGAGGWTLGDDNSGSNNTDTTYSISCADGDNADEEKIRLTAGGDGSGTDDIVLEAGSNMTVSRSGDKITFNSSFSDTDQLKNLSDTPNAYDDGKYLRSTATATEWASITQGVDKLKDLSDTPTGYDNGKYLKSTASGTEWASVTSGSSYTISAQDHGCLLYTSPSPRDQRGSGVRGVG